MPDAPREHIPEDSSIPLAEIRSAKRFSITWLMPLIAALIAGWLVYTTLASKGPTITISFLNGEGLETEKTKIKYKDVELGIVKDLAISKDLNSVIVTAEMRSGTEKYLTDRTKFWIAKAHVSAKEVRDLGTLLSGAYIGIDPALDGRPQSDFVGLERPPAVSNSRPGRFFALTSETLGSLSIGSPVLYRQIEVGQVTDYRLQKDNSSVLIDIFIESPFDALVRENSHFWNASGIRAGVSPSGVEITADSLISIFLGGIAFDSPVQDPMDPAQAGEIFHLYPNHDGIKDDKYTVRRNVLAYFDGPVRGLAPGAPVEFMGISVGEVVSIEPDFAIEKDLFRIRTTLSLKPQTIIPDADADAIIEHTLPLLVAKGLRAQLSTDNFLTGQLYVNLDFHANAAPAEMRTDGIHPQIPTVPSVLSQTTESIARVLKKLEQIPAQKLSQEMSRTLNNLDETLLAVKTTLEGANAELTPAITKTLEQFQLTTRELQSDFDGDSALQYQLQELLQELQMTSRSLRTLTDYLERRPQSIIFGKDEVEQ